MATRNNHALIHIHSKQLENNVAKAPTTDLLRPGEIAVNYSSSDPALFIEKENAVIAKFSSDEQIQAKLDTKGSASDVSNLKDRMQAAESSLQNKAPLTHNHTATDITGGTLPAAVKVAWGSVSGLTGTTASSFAKGNHAHNSTYLQSSGITNNAPTLAWGATSTAATMTIGSDTKYITVKMPANPNTNTTYSLSGSNATVTLTPSSGDAQSVTVNNVAKATAADHVVSAVTFSAGTFGSNITYSGNTAPSVKIPTHTSHLTNDSDFTTKAYVDGLVVSPVNYRGAITNATLPASASTKVGDLYIVQTSAITLTATQSATGAAQTAEPGDYIISRTRTTWDVMQKNLNNAVTGKDSTVFGNGKIIVGTGSGQVVSASTFTIAKSVPSDAKFTDTTYDVATTSNDGLMSSTDKTKLDGIASGANKYVHPSDGANTGSFGPSGNVSPSYGGTFSVPYVTVNSAGHVTAASTKTITLPASDNTDTKVTSVGNHYTPVSSTTKSASTNYAIAGIKMDAAGHVTDVVNSTYKVEKDVPSDAKFTDTHYTTGLKVGATSAATANATSTNGSTYINVLDNTTVRDSHLIKGTGKASVSSDANGVITINAAAGTYEETAGSGTATADSGYALSSVTLSAGHVLSKSTQVKIPSTPSEVGAAAASHTHDYEPTSTAVRHTASTAVGSTITPVYIASDGTATAIGYTIEKSVPSNAVFTDTNTKVTSVGNHYTPAENTSAKLSADASSTTSASWASTSLVTGVDIKRDAKGHVVGVAVDSIRMPANPNTNTTYSLSGSNATVTLTPSSGSAQSITVNNVANATSADKIDGYHVSVVTSMPSTPDANTIYILK